MAEELTYNCIFVSLQDLVIIVRLSFIHEVSGSSVACLLTWSSIMSGFPRGIWPMTQTFWPAFSAAWSCSTMKDSIPLGSGLWKKYVSIAHLDLKVPTGKCHCHKPRDWILTLILSIFHWSWWWTIRTFVYTSIECSRTGYYNNVGSATREHMLLDFEITYTRSIPGTVAA